MTTCKYHYLSHRPVCSEPGWPLAMPPPIYAKSCASCHGKDGKGDTKMGKKAGARDYTTAEGQKWSDAEGVKAILEGVKGRRKTR